MPRKSGAPSIASATAERARLELGLTHPDLARVLLVEEATLARWRSAERARPSARAMRRLALLAEFLDRLARLRPDTQARRAWLDEHVAELDAAPRAILLEGRLELLNGFLAGMESAGAATPAAEAARAAARARRLQLAMAALGPATTRDEVAASLITQARATLGAVAAAVLMLSDDGRELEVVRAEGQPASKLPAWCQLVVRPGMPSWEVLATGRAMYASSLAERSRRFPALARAGAPLWGAVAAMPLAGEDGTVGVLVAGFAEEHTFPREERNLCIALARMGSQALRRARLLEAEQRARAEAERIRARTEEILESITDAFYALDADWRFVYVNRRAEELWKRSRAELIGRNAWEEFPQAVGTAAHELHLRVARDRRPHYLEYPSPTIGSWVATTIYPSRWGGLTVYFQDITERKTAEAEREALLVREQEARRAAEAADRAKGQFIAVMSHELRTPITGVIGYADLLATEVYGTLSDVQKLALERIKASAWHLVSVIDEILTYSRTEAGKEKAQLSPTDATRLARECYGVLEAQAVAKGLRLRLHTTPGPVMVLADGGKARQVLLNLLGNAIKFTDAGKVELEVAVANGKGLFRVRDTGPGIAHEHRERIFEPFWQVDDADTRTVGGTGLGLTVSRRLARLMGGDVSVESEPDRGSTFTLALPLAWGELQNAGGRRQEPG